MNDKIRFLLSYLLFLIAAFLIFYVIILKRDNAIISNSLSQLRAEEAGNRSVIGFYLKKSLRSSQFDEFFESNTLLINEEGEQLLAKGIFSETDFICMFFPADVCPTCYNLVSLFELSKNENLPNLVIISHLERFAEIRSLAREFCNGHSTSLFAYDDANEPLHSGSDAIMFLWDGRHNQMKNNTYIPKDVNRAVLNHYTAIIESALN